MSDRAKALVKTLELVEKRGEDLTAAVQALKGFLKANAASIPDSGTVHLGPIPMPLPNPLPKPSSGRCLTTTDWNLTPPDTLEHAANALSQAYRDCGEVLEYIGTWDYESLASDADEA